MKKGLSIVLIALLALFTLSAQGTKEGEARNLVVYSAASEGEAESRSRPNGRSRMETSYF